MKTFNTFREDLNDKRLQLRQKQKASQQAASEKAAQNKKSFAQEIEDKKAEVAERQRKMKEREEVRREVRKEMEKDSEE